MPRVVSFKNFLSLRMISLPIALRVSIYVNAFLGTVKRDSAATGACLLKIGIFTIKLWDLKSVKDVCMIFMARVSSNEKSLLPRLLALDMDLDIFPSTFGEDCFFNLIELHLLDHDYFLIFIKKYFQILRKEDNLILMIFLGYRMSTEPMIN